MSNDAIIKKIEAYANDGMRVCVNFVCERCLEDATEDFKVRVRGKTSTKSGSGYWCDNCSIGSDHPDYQRKIDAILERKLG